MISCGRESESHLTRITYTQLYTHRFSLGGTHSPTGCSGSAAVERVSGRKRQRERKRERESERERERERKRVISQESHTHKHTGVV